jgi:hypothetical protein
MLLWLIELPDIALEALTDLAVAPGEPIPHAEILLWKWREDDTWVRKHPGVAVAIVKFLAERQSVPQWAVDNAVDILKCAFEASASRDAVLPAAEALVALSAKSARPWSSDCERRNAGPLSCRIGVILDVSLGIRGSHSASDSANRCWRWLAPAGGLIS